MLSTGASSDIAPVKDPEGLGLEEEREMDFSLVNHL